MSRTITALFILLLLLSCSRTDRSEEEIERIMAEQELAWNNGDIHGFMNGYSDTICFVALKGLTCGRDAVTANYVRSYPNAAAMGRLTFGLIEIIPAGGEHSWVSGTWRLDRNTDTLSGGFTLLWVKEKDGWRIARDHSY